MPLRCQFQKGERQQNSPVYLVDRMQTQQKRKKRKSKKAPLPATNTKRMKTFKLFKDTCHRHTNPIGSILNASNIKSFLQSLAQGMVYETQTKMKQFFHSVKWKIPEVLFVSLFFYLSVKCRTVYLCFRLHQSISSLHCCWPSKNWKRQKKSKHNV